jgi:hypothetical integral membrane protein (TIGR02206 family)
VRQFSIAHLVALGVLVVACAIAVIGPRRWPGRWVRWAELTLAAVVFAGWLGEYVADVILGTWSVKYTLPLQLTDAVSLAAIAALVTRRRLFVELVYFWALSASLQAALTPDLSSTFPDVFYFTYFAYHLGSIAAACLLVFGCGLYPRRRAIWRVYGLTIVWTALAAIGDLATGGNYMYLSSKPIHNSLLNVMGAWPWYIVSGAALALALFALLDAIATLARRRDSRRAAVTQRRPEVLANHSSRGGC